LFHSPNFWTAYRFLCSQTLRTFPRVL